MSIFLLKVEEGHLKPDDSAAFLEKIKKCMTPAWGPIPSVGLAPYAYDCEPRIHSHLTDGLPEGHRLVEVSVYCDECKAMLHSEPPNECMQTWVESGNGNFCLKCFAKDRKVLKPGDAITS